jgi:hypothetical protein
MHKILTAIFSLLVSCQLLAQSAFEGFYGQVGVGYGISSPSPSNGSGRFQVGGQSLPFAFVTTDSQSKDFLGTVTAGYYAAFRNNFLLGLGAEYTKNASKWTNTSTINNFGVTQPGQYAIVSSYNIFLSPAYAIDKDKLVYGKIGYMSSTSKIYEPGSADPLDTNNGYSLGLGYKQIITGGWYGFAEGNYFKTANQQYSNSGTINGYNFTATSITNSQSYQILAGVGYKF